ncbi:MAG TPA: hypothetical protein VFA03_11860 [Acetobacteraceae bacterium]|nr:hypothetical protein [Acetobacteraceae bacterium]
MRRPLVVFGLLGGAVTLGGCAAQTAAQLGLTGAPVRPPPVNQSSGVSAGLSAGAPGSIGGSNLTTPTLMPQVSVPGGAPAE